MPLAVSLWRRCWPVVAVLSLTTALLTSGCMWGIVRDETGAGVSGANVTYTDANGRVASTTTDVHGFFFFDVESASLPQWYAEWGPPPPLPGIASIQVSAPGHAPITETRSIQYDDNPNASLETPSTFWEIQNFDLTVSEDNPLARGYWKEEAQFACNTGEEVSPERPIQELLFEADGTFSVTWTPFERYRDYWGEYSYDTGQGTLDLTVTGGNNVPPDVDGSGTFAFDTQGRLILTDIWLGSFSDQATSANCGHRFIAAGH